MKNDQPFWCQWNILYFKARKENANEWRCLGKGVWDLEIEKGNAVLYENRWESYGGWREVLEKGYENVFESD